MASGSTPAMAGQTDQATGIISGHIRDAHGEPVPDLWLDAREVESGDWAGATTDSEGRYEMAVAAGRYRLSFAPIEGSYQSQYVPAKVDEESASVFEVTAGSEIEVDDTVLPVGTLSGRFTTAAGAPLSRAQVYFYAANDENMQSVHWATTGADGAFEVLLLAGAYKVGLFTDERHQYYPGQLAPDLADVVTVRGDQRTTITDSLLGTGAIRVTAVDSVTGAAVANFCANDVCSNGGGTVTVTGLPQGRHDLSLYTPDSRYFSRERKDVRVRADRTTDLTVKLRPGAIIATTVVDRQSGAPVRDVCLDAFLPKRVTLRDGSGNCSDRNGRIQIGPLTAGEYRLFAKPLNETYGRQWVGPDGGTGDERAAATVTATPGQVTTGPVVRLDRAGRLTGRVTDAQTGAPLAYAGVSVFTGHPGAGAEDARTDEQGRYTLTRLGPYEWPVSFGRGSYATVWSGGSATRFAATPVPITAAATATLDVALTPGVQLNGTFRNTDGQPLRSGWVVAHSVETGDITGAGWLTDGVFSMRMTGRQRVFFSYDVSLGEDQRYSGRYLVTDPDGTPRLARFTVPATGSTGVDLTISTS
ncbi:carboxypeptidase regulatory-like domain-containing protein [Micromonospora sp. NPDC003241]